MRNLDKRSGDWAHPDFLHTAAERANRRRLLVFLGTFVVALAIGLGYTWLRPAEYRASARLEITPAGVSAPSGPAASGPPPESRETVPHRDADPDEPPGAGVGRDAARASGQSLAAFGADPVADMQSHLQVNPVPNTNVVELVATGQQARGAGADAEHDRRRLSGTASRSHTAAHRASRWRRPTKK